MKNYIIGTLIVIILVLSSIIYKNEKARGYRFPALNETESKEVEVPLYLYVFFSKKNCTDCFLFIKKLNKLPPQFIVAGIVPEAELNDEMGLRQITGAEFPLSSVSKYKKYIPLYTPTTIGVSPRGDIIFILPGVPGEESYLENFLNSLYNKLYPLFLNEKMSQQTP